MYDTTVFQKMSSLASCLCATITEEGLPAPCYCGIVAGEVPAFEYVNSCDDECGMAWVRLASAGMETGIGIESVNRNNCDAVLGFDIEVGIVRCAPVGQADGSPPTVEDYLASADLQVADMQAMKKAIMCCAELGDFILTSYQPYGPVGGVVGGFWTVGTSEA